MRPALAIAVLLLAAVLAGCVEDFAGEIAEASHALPGSAMQADPLALPPVEPGDGGAGGVAILEPGTMLAWQADCPCPFVTFIAMPEPEVATTAWMEVHVRWDGTQTAGFSAALVLPDEITRVEGGRGFDDRLLRTWDPPSGRYRLDLDGAGKADITVRLRSDVIPGDGALLPNLVELVLEGPAVGLCDEVERTEQGAVTCMRFGNGVGNPGHGPVQIRLSMEQGVQALLPMDGRFVQEVRQADGSVEGHVVGPAVFHPSHGHWHYDGFALFELFHVDPATGLRGDLAASHHKSGFCFLDWDRMPENVTEPAEQERAETDCLVPGLGVVFSPEAPEGPPAWTNGISRGWYDFYESHLTDQYVDIAGLPAGTYELVATADPAGTLAETDETDNQSSLLLSIEGTAVEVLEERAHYRVQPDDDH